MRYLYLHGFASGPRSIKGLAFEAHFAKLGVAVERIDLRVPSFAHLRLSAMIETVRAALGEQTVIFGSSLGGQTAARVAERDPRVVGLVLLAPAFQIVERWSASLPNDGFAEWRRTGWRAIDDFTTGQSERVDFGFIEDVMAIDRGDADVRVPALIMHGARDEVVPIAHSRRFAAGRPNIELIELDDEHELRASIPRLLAESERFLRAQSWLSSSS